MEWNQVFNGEPLLNGRLCRVRLDDLSEDVRQRLVRRDYALQGKQARRRPRAAPAGAGSGKGKRKAGKEPGEGPPSSKQHKSQHKKQQRKTQQQTQQQQGPAGNGEAGPSGWDGQQLSSSQPQRPGDSNTSAAQQQQEGQGQEPGRETCQTLPQQQGQQGRLAGHSQRQQGQGGRKRKAAPRGGGGSDDSDDDFQQRPPPRASQPLSQPVCFEPQPGEGVAGQLKSIRLQSFMSHDNFTMDFRPNVNLISGENGSGKSAILQGLQCCLGVKAQETGRAHSIKKFVQEGKDQAVVQATLWNTGPEAYMPELLGRAFTIERRINASNGSGTTVVKNAAGATVLRGAKEVAKILDHLSINASNPAVVMTQDTSRSFVGSQSEGYKYAVYLEGLQLDVVIQNLHAAEEHVSEMQDLGTDLALRMKEVLGRLEERSQLLQSLQEVTSWKARHAQLLRCCAWEQVYDMERTMEDYRDKVERVGQQRIEQCAQQVATLQQHSDLLAAQLRGHQARLQELTARMEGHRAAQSQAKEELKLKRQQHHNLDRELKRAVKELRACEAECEDLVASVQEADEEYVRATQVEMESHKEKLKACKQQIEQATAVVQQAKNTIAERAAQVKDAEKEAETANREVRAANDRVRELQGELRRLERARADPLESFGGERMRAFCQRLEVAVRQGKFQRPPLGPIGTQLALGDDKWAVAVEASIGKLLDGFIVHCISDGRKLQEMAKGAGLRLTYFVSSYDLPQHRIPEEGLPPAHIMTLMRALKFKEGPLAHVVKNVLVDQARIERTVLADTEDEAVQLLRNAAFRERYNVNQFWVRDGSQARQRGKTQSTLPALRRYHPRLVQDVSVHEAECRRELEQAQRLGGEKQQDLDKARAWLNEVKSAHFAAQRDLKAATSRLSHAKAEQDTVATQAPVDARTEANDTATRVAQLQMRIAQEQGQVAALETAVEAARGEVEKAKQSCEQEAAAPQEMAEEIQGCEAAVVQTSELNAEVQAKLEKAREDEIAVRERVQKVLVELQKLEENLPEVTQEALKVCPREEEEAARAALVEAWAAEGKSEAEVAELLDKKSLEHQRKLFEDRIAQRQRSAGVTVEDLQDEIARLEESAAKRKAANNKVQTLLTPFLKGLAARQLSFRKMRREVAHVVSLKFKEYMKIRGHVASITVNYETQRLQFKVGVNGGEAVKDMKSLSGGERSFATVCFVMALGHAGLSPPFVCLDEFDVFMDAINRRYALRFLLEFASKFSHRQFLFFTPLDISSVEEAKQECLRHGIHVGGDFVHVVRMPPPRDRRGDN